ncbi:MAG: CAP domain-containing protein [Saccharofermentanales bacterium]
MVKRKSIVRRNIIWILLISIVFTSAFSVDLKADTLAENTEFVEIEPTETTEETDTETERSELTQSVESGVITDPATEITDIPEASGISDIAETTESGDLADRPETAVALTESETDAVLSKETTTEESAAVESEPAEQPAPTDKSGAEQEESATDQEESATEQEESGTEQEESATEESATAESNEDAQSDETKDLPAQTRRSRQSHVTRYIYANSIIRSAPNGSIITTLKMPLFVTGTIQGAWLKFTYNGSTAYVAMSVTTTNNPPITGYAKSAINVRKTPGGAVIGTVIRGDQVKGVLVGNWVKFTYNGSTGYVYVPLLQNSPVEQKYVYIKAGSNLRNSPNGQVIEKLDMPIYLKANVAGNWLYFQRNNRLNYVYNSNTQTTPLTVTGYLRGDTNARVSPDINSEIYEKLPIGSDISGTMKGDWVSFIVDNYYYSKTYYVHVGMIRKDPIIQVRYAKSDTNVRKYNNLKQITGKMIRGDFIKGRVIGDYIIENKNGIDMAVYRHNLSATPIPYAGYAIPNTNVRSAPNGSVLGKYSQVTYVNGTWQGNWLKIQYQGRTGYIYRTQLRSNNPNQAVTNQTSFTGADGTVVEGTPLTYGQMEQFLNLINEHRKNNGVTPLAYDYNWLEGGNIRAAEVTYKFDHTRPDGSSFDTAVPIDYCFGYSGEMIGSCSKNVETLFKRWKNIPANNKKLLNSDFDTVMFTGMFTKNDSPKWVAFFNRTEPW